MRFAATLTFLMCVSIGYHSSANALGGAVGNDGGDGVVCAPSKSNPLNGTYALDYLVFAQSGVPDPVAATSYRDSLFRIRQNIARKLPELAPSFDQFAADILNTDITRPNVWEATPYELVELDDQALGLTVRIPDNCRKNGNLAVVQAVVRQRTGTSGAGRTIFKYMPSVFSSLEKQSPIQLSFLLVHEWLWSFPGTVDRNRRLNWYLHSPEFESDSRNDVLKKVKAIGLDPASLPIVVDANGLGHYASLQQALQVAKNGQQILLMPGEYTTGGSELSQSINLKGEGPSGSVVINGTTKSPALEVSGDSKIENVILKRDDAIYVREVNDDTILMVTSGQPKFTHVTIIHKFDSVLRNTVQITGGAIPSFADSEFQCANAMHCFRFDQYSSARFDSVLIVSAGSDLFHLGIGQPVEFLNCTFDTPKMCPLPPSSKDLKATGTTYKWPKPAHCP